MSARKWLPFTAAMGCALFALLFVASGEISAARSRLVWKVIQGTAAVQDSVELLDIETRAAMEMCQRELKRLKVKK